MNKIDCISCAREFCPVWGDMTREKLDMECSGFLPAKAEEVLDNCEAYLNDSDGIVIGGTYRHYKGNEYQVLYAAKHTETGEDLIIYTRLHDPTKQVWARPAAMWNETVVRDGKTVKRFELVEDGDEDRLCAMCGWHLGYRMCNYEKPCVEHSGWTPADKG